MPSTAKLGILWKINILNPKSWRCLVQMIFFFNWVIFRFYVIYTTWKVDGATPMYCHGPLLIHRNRELCHLLSRWYNFPVYNGMEMINNQSANGYISWFTWSRLVGWLVGWYNFPGFLRNLSLETYPLKGNLSPEN